MDFRRRAELRTEETEEREERRGDPWSDGGLVIDILDSVMRVARCHCCERVAVRERSGHPRWERRGGAKDMFLRGRCEQCWVELICDVFRTLTMVGMSVCDHVISG